MQGFEWPNSAAAFAKLSLLSLRAWQQQQQWQWRACVVVHWWAHLSPPKRVAQVDFSLVTLQTLQHSVNEAQLARWLASTSLSAHSPSSHPLSRSIWPEWESESAISLDSHTHMQFLFFFLFAVGLNFCSFTRQVNLFSQFACPQQSLHFLLFALPAAHKDQRNTNDEILCKLSTHTDRHFILFDCHLHLVSLSKINLKSTRKREREKV